MADGVKLTDTDVSIARTGIMLQVEAKIPMIKEFDGTVEEAIEHYQLKEFLDHIINVSAYDKAHIRELSNIVHGVNK